MPSLKTSELPADGALTGAELVALVQDGANVQSTAQAVADLAAGATTLAALTDVDVTGATDGQVLTYDGTEEEWVPTTVTGGEGGGESFHPFLLMGA